MRGACAVDTALVVGYILEVLLNQLLVSDDRAANYFVFAACQAGHIILRMKTMANDGLTGGQGYGQRHTSATGRVSFASRR